PLTSSPHATGCPSLMHTRSKRTGDLSLACSIRNFGRWSWTAVWSSIGMFTSPNEIDPFQSGLSKAIAQKRSQPDDRDADPVRPGVQLVRELVHGLVDGERPQHRVERAFRDERQLADRLA